jgi:hypothetical protein
MSQINWVVIILEKRKMENSEVFDFCTTAVYNEQIEALVYIEQFKMKYVKDIYPRDTKYYGIGPHEDIMKTGGVRIPHTVDDVERLFKEVDGYSIYEFKIDKITIPNEDVVIFSCNLQ